MEIKQFEDKNLSHYSYAIESNGEVALIDPARNPQPYYEFAKQHNSKITTVIETHPHADFVSSHSEVKNNKIFTNAIHIPLHELRERTNEIPFHKPIVVNCAGGYRSAAGSSIIKSKLNGTSQVYDLSEAVNQFQK